MQLNLLHGYPDVIGKRFAFVGNGAGPSSYVQVTTADGGDPLTLPGFQNYIDWAGVGVSVSRTYIAYPIPVLVGSRQLWRLKWCTASNGTEVSAATDLSAERVQIGGFGGQY